MCMLFMVWGRSLGWEWDYVSAGFTNSDIVNVFPAKRGARGYMSHHRQKYRGAYLDSLWDTTCGAGPFGGRLAQAHALLSV